MSDKISTSPFNGPFTEELRVMTGDVYVFMQAHGCEPTCHGCHQSIKVGDEFGFGKMTALLTDVAEGDLGQYRPVATARGSMCAKCIVKGVDQPPVKASPAEAKRMLQKVDSPPRGLGFMVDDKGNFI